MSQTIRDGTKRFGPVTVRTTGFDKINLGIDQLFLNLKPFKAELLLALGNRLITLIMQRVPVNTGAYARSWRILEQRADSIIVGTTAPPALFIMLEFSGARPHLIRPKDKQALRFEVGGDIIWASEVNHPGFKAQPHFRPAVLDLSREAQGIAYRVMSRHFPIIQKETARAASQRGIRKFRQIGRSERDVTANIGRGTKGKITAQLTSRRSYRKRIRIRGTRRVGTAERKKVGFKVAGKRSRSGEQSL